jgi:ABC-type polysaccharide/polyol phosphate export permease
VASGAFLFEQLVRRELRQKYQGSVLGVAWYLVNPLVLMAAYWFLFDVVLDVFGYEDYPLFLLCGLVVWIFFSQALMQASSSLLDHGALIRKARFAREVIPASVVSVQLLTFLVVLVLLTVVTVAVRGTLEPALLLLPVVIACLAVFVLGVALAVAVLHAFFRDVAPILGAALLPWFFLSPIFFGIDQVTENEAARFVLEWVNPVAPYIVAVRDVLYAGHAPSAAVLLYIAAAAAAALLIGRALFRRLDGELAVVV